ncbi:MAG TPA: monofunctional biosynthetic peptidoglycan transglycosylase [Desulfobacterales bacterium]
MKKVWLPVAALLILSLPAFAVLPLRWIDPPSSAFMLRQFYGAEKPVHYQWVDLEQIAECAGLAVVAAEDQKFPNHWGFDRESIADAWQEHRRGTRVRGASTITQQVAKNLFLWPGRSFLRKGIEAWFTVWIELLWPKRRILEVYLNVAQFGPDVYGVQAAGRRYFGKTARELNRSECALLATVLPNPNRMRLSRPSPYMRKRAEWIRGEMERLDRMYDRPYLNNL